MSSRILLEKSASTLTLHAPDHPTLDAQAASLSGKRKGGSWTFPVSQEASVRKLARDLFGTNGDDGGAKVTLRVDLSLFGEGSVGQEGEAWLAGRLLARRPSHDARVQLGEGVRLVRGGFGVWGGARNHPALDARYGTVVDVEGVPRTAAELATEKYPITTAIVTPKVDTVVGAWSKTMTTRDASGGASRPAAKAAKAAPKAAAPKPAAKAAKAKPAKVAKAKPAAKATKPAAKPAKPAKKAKAVKAKPAKAVKAKAPKKSKTMKAMKSKARAAAKTVTKAAKKVAAKAKGAAKKASKKMRKAVAAKPARSAKKKSTKKK